MVVKSRRTSNSKSPSQVNSIGNPAIKHQSQQQHLSNVKSTNWLPLENNERLGNVGGGVGSNNFIIETHKKLKGNARTVGNSPKNHQLQSRPIS